MCVIIRKVLTATSLSLARTEVFLGHQNTGDVRHHRTAALSSSLLSLLLEAAHALSTSTRATPTVKTADHIQKKENIKADRVEKWRILN